MNDIILFIALFALSMALIRLIYYRKLVELQKEDIEAQCNFKERYATLCLQAMEEAGKWSQKYHELHETDCK